MAVYKNKGIDEWIKKPQNICTMEYYSVIKRNTLESVLMKWMNLEPIILSEVCQKEKNKYHILTCIYGIYKDGTDKPVGRDAMDPQTQRTDVWTRVGKKREGVRLMERVAWKRIHQHM